MGRSKAKGEKWEENEPKSRIKRQKSEGAGRKRDESETDRSERIER